MGSLTGEPQAGGLWNLNPRLARWRCVVGRIAGVLSLPSEYKLRLLLLLLSLVVVVVVVVVLNGALTRRHA